MLVTVIRGIWGIWGISPQRLETPPAVDYFLIYIPFLIRKKI